MADLSNRLILVAVAVTTVTVALPVTPGLVEEVAVIVVVPVVLRPVTKPLELTVATFVFEDDQETDSPLITELLWS